MRTIIALVLASSLVALAQAAPPPAGHPILGTWSFTLPSGKCTETYTFRANGTMSVSSGEERADGTYDVSPTPTGEGFYKWVAKVTKDNGKKDCAGDITRPGQEVSSFVRFGPGGDMVVCERAALDSCFGPFMRVSGQGS